MFKKRGQVALYVIVAILIVAFAFIAYSLYNNYKIKQEEIKLNKILPVKQAVEDCLYVNSKDALVITGLQGGYTEPKNFLETNISRISYWYYEGRDTKPSISTIEKELSNYIDLALPICLNLNIPKNFSVDFNTSKTKTTIQENLVSFSVYFPITVRQQDSAIRVSRFNTKVDLNLSRMYQTASKIVADVILNPDEVSLTNYLDSGFDILIMPYDEKNIIYNIIDNSTQIYNESYMFMFANKFK